MDDLKLLEICKKDNKIFAKMKKALNETYIYSTAVIYSGNHPLKTACIGSGTFVILKGQKGVLTNHHVAKVFIGKKYIEVNFTEEGSMKLPFCAIVSLPSFENDANGVDLSFIMLNDIACDLVTKQLHKKFFNLDQDRIEYKNNNFLYRNFNAAWVIHGAVAEKMKEINNRKTLFLKYAGPYIVVPDLDDIKLSICEYGSIFVKFDNIICPMGVASGSSLPKEFDGMSGAALWNIIFDEQDQIFKIMVVGVATIQDKNPDNERLICRGPKTLYDSFYELCGMLHIVK